jgi:hypothetical protein
VFSRLVNITLRLDEMSSSIAVLVTRVCGQHGNLLREVFELDRLLGCMGKDQSLLRHGLGVKLFMQDFNSRSDLGSFLIELAEMGNLPSQPLVVKVTDVMLQVHEVTAGPNEEGAEPGGERFNRVFLAMPNCVSLHIQVNNVRGLIWALLLMKSGDPSIFQLLDPLGRFEDSIAEGNIEVGHPPVILNIAVGGLLKYVFVMFDAVMESADLLLEVADFTGLLGVMLGDGCEEPISDGSEDVCVKIGVGRQGGCNGTRRHRWFQTLDRSDLERGMVLSRRGI